MRQIFLKIIKKTHTVEARMNKHTEKLSCPEKWDPNLY